LISKSWFGTIPLQKFSPVRGHPQPRAMRSSPGQFRRYAIENAFPFHPCADACDYDADGDVDVAFGNFMMFPDETRDPMPCITLLESHKAGGN